MTETRPAYQFRDCPFCREPIEFDADHCDTCGSFIEPPKRKKTPIETTFKTIADYQLAVGGEIEKCRGELTLTLPDTDAVAAAQIAIDAVRVAAGGRPIVSLRLSVAIVHDKVAETEWAGEIL